MHNPRTGATRVPSPLGGRLGWGWMRQSMAGFGPSYILDSGLRRNDGSYANVSLRGKVGMGVKDAHIRALLLVVPICIPAFASTTPVQQRLCRASITGAVPRCPQGRRRLLWSAPAPLRPHRRKRACLPPLPYAAASRPCLSRRRSLSARRARR